MNCTNSSKSTNSTCPPGGPVQSLSIEWIIVLDILYVIIVVVGCTGNVMTCAATFLQKSMRRSLHLYVFNLAVCDLLVLIFYVPIEMMRMGNYSWYLWGSGMCTLTTTVLPVAMNSTVFTLIAISIDRARGVLQPFEWRADPKGSARVALPIIWTVSVSIAIPIFMYTRLEPFNCGYVCAAIWPSLDKERTYWYTMFALTFSIPLAVIFILHLVMIYIINYNLVATERRDDRRMIKMTVLIVIIFTVCTGCQHIYFFIQVHYKSLARTNKTIDDILFYGSNMLFTVQSACNPIIYGKFRDDFNVAYRQMVQAVGRMLRAGHMVLLNGGGTADSSFKKLSTAREMAEVEEGTPPLSHPIDDVSTKKVSFPSRLSSESVKSQDASQVSVNKNPINSSLDDSARPLKSDENAGMNERKAFTANGMFNRSMSADSETGPYYYKSHEREFDGKKITESDNGTIEPLAITTELRNISKLLNELRDTEVLDNLTDNARLSRQFLKLTEEEKNSLRGNYPSVEWLEVLHLLRDSEETDI